MIRELTIFEFEEFAEKHILSSYYQTKEYATVAAQKGFKYEYIGYFDSSENLLAASLILYKKIKSFTYGYAPKGFLLDYTDNTLLSMFTDAIKKYYLKKGLAFIKINPEVAVGEISLKDYTTTYNSNSDIRSYLINLGYKKLKDNLYFESRVPRFNAIVNTRTFDLNKINKNSRNKVKQALRKGLVFIKGTRDDVEDFYKFVKDKMDYDSNYYKDYYNVFSKNNSIDLFLVKINYEQYLINSRDLYAAELARNNQFNYELMMNNTNANINKKMQSDRLLSAYKDEIADATVGLGSNNESFIAGALVIKHDTRVSILLTGFDKEYKKFQPNYFLHYKIIEYYKNEYPFLDLNGVSGDFTSTNVYRGINRFKFGWKPRVYEFIGEFDLVVNDVIYKTLDLSGTLAKELNKKENKH